MSDLVNRGKGFEVEIRKAFNALYPQISLDRFLDQIGGLKGIANICDFIAFKYPNMIYLECKSLYKDRFSFSRITDNQYEGLIKKSKIPGVYAGYLIWFMDKDDTVFVPSQVIQNMREEGAKSISYKNILELKELNKCFSLKGKKKRAYFNYDMSNFFEEVRSLDI